MAFGLTSLATLCIVAFLIEDFRGEAAWKRYVEEAKRRGVELEFSAFLPTPVPDEENFAAIPFFIELASPDAAAKSRLEAQYLLPRGTPQALVKAAASRGAPLDFVEIRALIDKTRALPEITENAPADVLQALELYEPVLSVLRSAALRPRSQFRGSWRGPYDGDLYQLGDTLSLNNLIVLRTDALLASGRSDEALTVWRIAERLSSMLAHEPTLLPGMLRVTLIAQALPPVWRGMAQGRWLESELAEIEFRLRGTDLKEAYVKGVQSERAAFNTTLEQSLASPRVMWPTLFGGPALSHWLRVLPRGWLRQNQLRVNQWFDQVARADSSTPAYVQQRTPFTYLLDLVAYNSGEMAAFPLATQTELQLCRIAIALERFRLRTGAYPTRLEELTLLELKELPIDGYEEPFRYVYAGEERLLYSTGENRKDDAGEEGEDRKDITWRLPAS
jgi:hypothetical protein